MTQKEFGSFGGSSLMPFQARIKSSRGFLFPFSYSFCRSVRDLRTRRLCPSAMMDPPIKRFASVLVASPPEPGRFLHAKDLHAKELPRRLEVSHPTPLPLHTHHDSRLFAPVLGRNAGVIP